MKNDSLLSPASMTASQLSRVTLVVLVALCYGCFLCWAQQCGSQAGGATCSNNLCCSQYGYCGTSSAYCGSQCQSGPCTSGGRGSPPTPSTPSGNKLGVSDIITSSIFNKFLSQRTSSSCPSKGFYTYKAFLSAAAAYSGFGTSGSSDVRKRELAAFFANVAHETGSGCYVEEIEKATYCNSSSAPCAAGQQYYGRGPLQLSWNFNYQAAGKAIGFDGINNPGIVAKDATISFKTAVWYWMTQASPTCHSSMVTGKGFGATINAINGGLECGSSANQSEQQDRIKFYKSFCSILGVQPGNNLTC